MNLQTLSYIALMDGLFTKNRTPQIHAEHQLLADFEAVESLLHETFSDEYIASLWRRSDESIEGTITRKDLGKSLDISFHRYFKKLHSAFKNVREYYVQIIPEIDYIYVNSLPSVMALVESYSIKSQMFQRDQRNLVFV